MLMNQVVRMVAMDFSIIKLTLKPRSYHACTQKCEGAIPATEAHFFILCLLYFSEVCDNVWPISSPI